MTGARGASSFVPFVAKDAPLPHEANVCAMASYLSAQFGDQPQIIEPGKVSSFAEIERQSREIATGLLAQKIGKGAHVGVLMPNGADWLAAMVAIQRIGAVAVLLSTFAKGQELAEILHHSDIQCLLMADKAMGHDLVDRLENALPELTAQAEGEHAEPQAPLLKRIYIWGGTCPEWATGNARDLVTNGSAPAKARLDAAEASLAPTDPALIIYTSGSSALPKAVIHSHGNLVEQAHRMASYMTYQPGDRMVTSMPFFWVGGLVTSLLASSYCGAALICPASGKNADVIASIRDHDASHITFWLQQLSALFTVDDITELMAQLRPNSAQQLGLFGLTSPEETPNALGMTETLGPHSMEYLDGPLPAGCEGSFGRQVGQIERMICDPETGALLPAGQTGEIVMRGGHLMLGMHRQEDASVFRPDGGYATGDLGRIDSAGHLYFEGRKGDMVKSAGVNIAPAEVEAAIGKIDGINECTVLGAPVSGGEEELVAAIVMHTGAKTDGGTISKILRDNLSSYKIPKHFYFLPAGDVPRTATGKVQRPALRELVVKLSA